MLIMLSGINSLKTIKEVIRGYTGDRNSNQIFYDENVYQGDLFRTIDKRINSKELMTNIDKINTSGVGRITFASQGIKRTWSMRRLLKSPRYLTNWEEIPVVK